MCPSEYRITYSIGGWARNYGGDGVALTTTGDSGLLDAIVAVLAGEQDEAAAGVAGLARLGVQGVAGDDDGRHVRRRPALAHDAAGPGSREPEQRRQPPRRRLLDHRECRRGRVHMYLVWPYC